MQGRDAQPQLLEPQVARSKVHDLDTAAPLIVANDLAVRLGARTIWSDANFHINRGEFVAVLGPNGAGKSTLLRLVLGLLRPSHGNLQVLGGLPKLGSAAIGYVPQRRTLNPELSVRGRDLVALGLDGHRWGFQLSRSVKRQQQAEVQTALEAVEATAYADRPIGQLSGGEQQRLLLAQALVGKPRLLLLDEPLASLDLRNQSAVAQLVARLARDHTIAVLLVAHDVNPLISVVD
ncbi:MAG: ATP-binding cassette domain-containing protein, partial [Herpetosiphonaceae bacterium]|nr:ATP-binding cassette domain-containing protein [Herpetosiphonaceae bacterium]